MYIYIYIRTNSNLYTNHFVCSTCMNFSKPLRCGCIDSTILIHSHSTLDCAEPVNLYQMLGFVAKAIVGNKENKDLKFGAEKLREKQNTRENAAWDDLGFLAALVIGMLLNLLLVVCNGPNHLNRQVIFGKHTCPFNPFLSPPPLLQRLQATRQWPRTQLGLKETNLGPTSSRRYDNK